MEHITVEELDPGVILEVTKPNGATYKYTTPKDNSNSSEHGVKPKQTEIGVFCIRDDVVQVVRCKNCIHYEMGVCLKIYQDGNEHSEAWQPRRPDDFCSRAKRSEG